MMRRGLMDITAVGMVVDMVEGLAVAMVATYLDVVGTAAGMVTLGLAVDMVVVVAAAGMAAAAAVDMEAVAVMVVDMAAAMVVGAVILELDIMVVEVVDGTRSYKQALYFNNITR
jgi:hypothetical protein